MTFRRLFLLFALIPATLQAVVDDPELQARSALLMDAATGTILLEKNADAVIPPASLTKLMTMHVVLEEVQDGRLSLDDRVDLPEPSWATSQPWHSSLMFLAPGQIVSLRELLLGLAVSSGNDAAVAVALHSAGSIPAFVAKMNAAAENCGLVNTHFVEPSGISEKNLTTARDFAVFCRYYLERHPESLASFHSIAEFAYPKPENLPNAYRKKPGTIIQKNRNTLVGVEPGVDGIKTGFIIESGYHYALTAKKEETRLIAVLLGVPNTVNGARERAEDGQRLLDWGFSNYRTIRPVIDRLDGQRIWKGRSEYATLEPAEPLEFTVGNDRGYQIQYEVVHRKSVVAPVNRGDRLADLVFSDEDGELRRVDLVAVDAIGQGSWLKRAADTVKMFFLGLFNERAL